MPGLIGLPEAFGNVGIHAERGGFPVASQSGLEQPSDTPGRTENSLDRGPRLGVGKDMVWDRLRFLLDVTEVGKFPRKLENEIQAGGPIGRGQNDDWPLGDAAQCRKI